jgi:hypothetical protein
LFTIILIFDYSVTFYPSHKPQFAYLISTVGTVKPQNGEYRLIADMVGNGRSAEQLSIAQPFDLMRTPPHCDYVAGFEFEVL